MPFPSELTHPAFTQLVSHLVTQLAGLRFYLGQSHHLSLREVSVLGVLATQGAVSFTELHRALSIPKSVLTGLADRLNARGVIERRHDKRDRRRWLVSLTPLGQQFTAAITAEETRAIEMAMRNLSESEQEVFVKSLQAINGELAQAQRRGGRPPPTLEPGSNRRRKKE